MARLNFAILYASFVAIGSLIVGSCVALLISSLIWGGATNAGYLLLVIAPISAWIIVRHDRLIYVFPTREQVYHASPLSVFLMILANLFGPFALAFPVAISILTSESGYLLLHWLWLITGPIALVCFAISMSQIKKLKQSQVDVSKEP